MRPLVAIVGRPNVGKSTLFNRLAGKKLAIVEDLPGVTRDRHYKDIERNNRELTIIDTGGFVPNENDPLLKSVREQAQLAVDECEVILFVVDGKHGLITADHEIAKILRRSGKPIIVVVNKLDDARKREVALAEFHTLGFPDPIGLSAEHGSGIDELDDAMLAALPPEEPKPEVEEEEFPFDEEEVEEKHATPTREEKIQRAKEAPVRVAIVGRPNVGKSTLINALLGKDRLVASEIPGTTRDPIDSALEFNKRKYILTDTAGIRRKRSIAARVESFAVVASLRTVDNSDVAVLLVDATEPAVDQDARLAGIAEDKGRALLVVVNKWDKLEKLGGDKQRAMRDELKLAFKFIAYAPVIFTSALTGSKVTKVLELAATVADQLHYRAPTPQLNKLLEYVKENHPTPVIGGKQLRLYYMAQVGVSPPAFAVTCNKPNDVPDAYRRYLINQIRKTFDLRVPIRIFFRERPGKRATRPPPPKNTRLKNTRLKKNRGKTQKRE